VDNFREAVKPMFGDKTDQLISMYQVKDDASVTVAATDLASDMFIAFSTWKWTDLQKKTGGKPVYRYHYCHPRPALRSATGDKASVSGGAVHSADIEYAMGNLSTNRVFNWQADDFKISEIFQTYYLNFVKTGNPNGLGVPQWPAINNQAVPPVLQIDVDTHVTINPDLEKRYEFLNSFYFSAKK
jgi:para-nitrobenzyl esterase